MTESNSPHRQRLVARVAELTRLAGDITLLRLDPGTACPFRFRAGQYAQLTFGELPPRDYSIGSRPDEMLLEFHIRDTGDGGSSSYVAHELRVGDPVGIEGPFGQGYLRDTDPRPVLAIAGGAGLAPMKSIVETLLAAGARQKILLYFGVRRESDVYLGAELKSLARAHPNLDVQIVLSESSAGSGFRLGLVSDAVAEDLDDLDRFTAYVAGPLPMVEATCRLLAQRGLPRARIYADPLLIKPGLQSLGSS
ncbi:MAG: FAD-binding oxidoreductase [Kiloniellales bacterium]|nr:FAD-binding oxidoreductase [Kiloniellales bacterium]